MIAALQSPIIVLRRVQADAIRSLDLFDLRIVVPLLVGVVGVARPHMHLGHRLVSSKSLVGHHVVTNYSVPHEYMCTALMRSND